MHKEHFPYFMAKYAFLDFILSDFFIHKNID